MQPKQHTTAKRWLYSGFRKRVVMTRQHALAGCASCVCMARLQSNGEGRAAARGLIASIASSLCRFALMLVVVLLCLPSQGRTCGVRKHLDDIADYYFAVSHLASADQRAVPQPQVIVAPPAHKRTWLCTI